jgi:hypothetical protein
MRSANPPACYAVHRLPGDRWEIVATDDDPRRPPWRRVEVVSCSSARPIRAPAPRRMRSVTGGAVVAGRKTPGSYFLTVE